MHMHVYVCVCYAHAFVYACMYVLYGDEVALESSCIGLVCNSKES
jgi:hypothetical protein